MRSSENMGRQGLARVDRAPAGSDGIQQGPKGSGRVKGSEGVRRSEGSEVVRRSPKGSEGRFDASVGP